MTIVNRDKYGLYVNCVLDESRDLVQRKLIHIDNLIRYCGNENIQFQMYLKYNFLYDEKALEKLCQK